MADVATLGIAVKETGTKEAAEKLNVLSGAAARAEAETQGLTKAHGGATGAATAAAKSYAAANDNASKLASASKNSSMQLRMMAMQFSQVAQQAQAGGGILRALAIQLPDLALGFGPIGIAAGVAAGAVLSYFSNVLSSGLESNHVLAEQSKLIQSVANDWGLAAPRLKGYADELERLARANALLASGNAAAEAQFTPIVDLLGSINQQYTAAIRTLRGFGEDTTSVVRGLNTSFGNLQSKIMEGSATTNDLKGAQDALATAVDKFGTPAVNAFAAAFANLVPEINRAIEAAAGYRAEATGLARIAMFPSHGAYLGVDRSADGNIQNPGFMTPEIGPVPGSRPLIELEGLPRVRGAGRAANDNFKSSVLSIQERTKAIQAETAAQAALNPLVNDYGFAITKARTSADLLAAAERAKKDITPGLIAQIDETSTALARATAEQNKQADAVNKYKATIDFLKSTTAGFLNDLRDGLRDGEGFWQSLGDAATGVLDRITDKLLNETLDALFKVNSTASGGGASGGGILGGIMSFLGFGGGGKSAAPSWLDNGFDTSRYAAGTPAARPGLAWVGERGPELVRFKGGEEVIPNHRIISANQNSPSNRSGGATTSDVRVTADVRAYVDDNGNWQAKVENISAGVSQAVVGQYDRDKSNLYQNGNAA